jgi:ABC-type Fe3+/spermidine/putrescine transport system ATPase subunit
LTKSMKSTDASSKLEGIGSSGDTRQPLLRLRGLSKQFGSATAVYPLDLNISAGSFTAILGPSGCGKSTLLRMIAGFVRPTAGQIEIEGVDVTNLNPEHRPTNMVFQGYGLFPHMSVEENIGFGLSIAKIPREDARHRIAEMLALARLTEFARRNVEGLSGGQQQRVALARALIMRPLVLLLDEPLAALDLKLRQSMQEELRRIHKEIGGTFLFVTHDQNEAFSLADHLVLMNDGKIEQEGEPREVYRNPRSLFAAQFVGDTNILEGMRDNDRVTLDVGGTFSSRGPEGRVRFVLRPESIRIGEDGTGEIRVVVRDAIYLGSEVRLIVGLPGGQILTVRVSDPDHSALFVSGSETTVQWNNSALQPLELQ